MEALLVKRTLKRLYTTERALSFIPKTVPYIHHKIHEFIFLPTISQLQNSLPIINLSQLLGVCSQTKVKVWNYLSANFDDINPAAFTSCVRYMCLLHRQTLVTDGYSYL